jgi:hypothetical protein
VVSKKNSLRKKVKEHLHFDTTYQFLTASLYVVSIHDFDFLTYYLFNIIIFVVFLIHLRITLRYSKLKVILFRVGLCKCSFLSNNFEEGHLHHSCRGEYKDRYRN